ncbi:MAG: hypothetical protein PHO80_02370, partial [Candidatus Gracilibacteria bacterium]|nr:hypothetical protein [Candidatus Gracilibacteria bacterium]
MIFDTTENTKEKTKITGANKNKSETRKRAQVFIGSIDKTQEEKNQYEQMLNSWDEEENDLKNKYEDLAGNVKKDTVKNLGSLKKEIDSDMLNIKTTFKKDTNWFGDVTDEGKKKIQNKAQELKTSMDKSSQEAEDLDKTKNVYLEESFEGFLDGETEQTINDYKQSQKEYINNMLGTSDDLEDLAVIVGEKVNIQDRVKNIPTLVNSMGPDEAIQFLKDTHQSIDDNNFQSDKNKADYKALADALHGAIKDKLSKLPQNEENKKYILSFAKIITDREGNIDNDLKDPKVATEVLLKAMMFKDGVADQLIKKGKFNLIDNKVKSKDFNGIYNSLLNAKIPVYTNSNGQQTQTNVLELAGFLNFPAGKEYSELSMEEKIRVGTLVRFQEQAGVNLEKIPNIKETKEIDKKINTVSNKLQGIYKKLNVSSSQTASENPQLNQAKKDLDAQKTENTELPKIEQDPNKVLQNLENLSLKVDELEKDITILIDPRSGDKYSQDELKKISSNVTKKLGIISQELSSAQTSFKIIGEQIKMNLAQTFNNISADTQKEMFSDTFNKISSTSFGDLFNWDHKTEGQELGLNSIDSEIYDTYLDMEGVGLFNLSDESIQKIQEYSKSGLLMAVAIVSVTALSVCCPALGMLAIASISSAITTGTGALIYQQGFDSTEQMALDLGSDFTVNAATNLFGGKLGQQGAKLLLSKFGATSITQALGLGAEASIKEVTVALSTKEGIKKITPILLANTGIDIVDFTQGTGAEYLRQKYLLGKTDLNFSDMMANGVQALFMGKIMGSKINKDSFTQKLQQKIYKDEVIIQNPGIGNNIVLKPEEANLLFNAGLIDEAGKPTIEFSAFKEVLKDIKSNKEINNEYILNGEYKNVINKISSGEQSASVLGDYLKGKFDDNSYVIKNGEIRYNSYDKYKELLTEIESFNQFLDPKDQIQLAYHFTSESGVKGITESGNTIQVSQKSWKDQQSENIRQYKNGEKGLLEAVNFFLFANNIEGKKLYVTNLSPDEARGYPNGIFNKTLEIGVSQLESYAGM